MRQMLALICLTLLTLSAGAWAQDAVEVQLGKVWSETLMGNPEAAGQTGRGFRPLPTTAFKFENGLYKSVVSRISLKLPRLGPEDVVSVREAVVSQGPGGRTITSHLIFVPGVVGMVADDGMGVSAVVVTRLRDDRPKDRESILKRFEPPNEQERQRSEGAGIVSSRVKTDMGEAVQRSLTNRRTADPFPYRVTLGTGSAVSTVGVTRFVVIEGDSLIEFSQVLPCGDLGAEPCRLKAIAASDRFLAGVAEFKMWPVEMK